MGARRWRRQASLFDHSGIQVNDDQMLAGFENVPFLQSNFASCVRVINRPIRVVLTTLLLIGLSSVNRPSIW